jgi:hypothetical protein
MWTCLLSLGLIILRAVHCIHESKGDTLASTILNETSVGGGSRLLAEGDAAKDECIPWNDNLNVLVLLIISVVFLGFTVRSSEFILVLYQIKIPLKSSFAP